jgi:hypothetical protein
MKRIVSSLAFAAGMLATSAFAATTTYTAHLSGPAEAVPVFSPGYGVSTIVIDDVANTLQLTTDFSWLVSPTVAAHIHAGTEQPLLGTTGVAVPANGFPEGVTSGTYSVTYNLLDAATYTSGYWTANGGTAEGARDSLIDDLNTGRAYFNIHTVQYAGGEIRGFYIPSPVPEPGTYAMLAIGLAGIAVAARQKRKQEEAA